jgi:hypothetical protein
VLPAKSEKARWRLRRRALLDSDYGCLVQAIAVRRHGHRMMVVMTMMEVALHLELRL